MCKYIQAITAVALMILVLYVMFQFFILVASLLLNPISIGIILTLSIISVCCGGKKDDRNN